MRKSLFIAPILPAYQLQVITEQVGDGGHQRSAVKTVSGVKRRLFRLQVYTLRLRMLSALIFVCYFMLLPMLYMQFGLGSYVYAAVGLAYCLQGLCALSYFLLQRRFFPKEIGVRVLHSIYNLLLPWHAMRAADELFFKSSAHWSELALLAAIDDNASQTSRLALYWRQSQLLESSSYSAAVLQPVMQEIHLSSASAMRAVVPEQAGQNYCPCCGILYRSDVTTCIDCRGMKLRES
jgi:hypothetical protein